MPLDISWASLQTLRDAYTRGECTVREVVFSCLKRIVEIDSGEGGLHSVLEINPDALSIADALDARLREGAPLPPLFGVPVLLKDNIATGDRMVTSAGSLALENLFADSDAEVAARLRQAGAVLLGKTNMTEFANYITRGMTNGYSSRGGQTVCPHNRAVDPSGSSSGSAVAVAAGICPVAVGSETSGSIMSPSMRNGIVGIKPTAGLLSGEGIIPISSTLDTAGPMARSVWDAAALLSVLAGEDYLSGLTACDLRGMRVGINRCHEADVDAESLAAFEALLGALEGAGATCVSGADFEKSGAPTQIMRYEFKRCMNACLSKLSRTSPVRTLSDIIRKNQDTAERSLKFGQALLLEAQNETSGRLIEPEYWAAMGEREEAIRALDLLFDEKSLDVILCAAPTNIAPFTGFPSMTIPIGRRADGVPVGSYWIARRHAERTLLNAARAAETLLSIEIRPDI